MQAKLTVGILVWLVSVAAPAMEYDVDRTLEVGPTGIVKIEVPRGDVDVSGWDRNEVRVVGRIDREAEEFVFEARDDETLVQVRMKRRGHWGDGESDLDVFVPTGSEVEVKGVSLDVGVTDIAGGVKGGTVSGDINVEDVKRRVDVGSVSGDVMLRRCEGRINVSSVSGDIDVRETDGEGSYESVSGSILVRGTEQLEIETETVSGEIVVDLERFREVHAESVSGEIELSGAMLAKGRVDLESVSGRVQLSLADDPDAVFEVETDSGRIRNDLTNDKPRVARYSRSSELRFTLGEGSGLVVVSTASGRVVLRRR